MEETDDLANQSPAASRFLDRHVAYHEAGHALAAYHYGRKVLSLSLNPGRTVLQDDRTESLMRREEPVDAEDDAYLLESVKISMAGYVGEQVGLGRAHTASMISDMEKASAILRRLQGRGPAGFGLQDEVRAKLESGHPDLIRIAEALLANRVLAEEQFAALFPSN